MLKISDKNFFLQIVADFVIDVHLTSRTDKPTRPLDKCHRQSNKDNFGRRYDFSSLGFREKFLAFLVGGFKRNLRYWQELSMPCL